MVKKRGEVLLLLLLVLAASLSGIGILRGNAYSIPFYADSARGIEQCSDNVHSASVVHLKHDYTSLRANSTKLILGNATVLSSIAFRNSTLLLATDKQEFFLGEQVRIFFIPFNTTTAELTLETPSGTFSLLGAQSPLSYSPQTLGNYTLKLTNATRLLATASFKIVPMRSTSFSYALGDTVSIPILELVESYTPNTSLYITSQDESFVLLGGLTDTVLFVPKYSGEYTATLQEENNTLAMYSFVVIPDEKINATPTDHTFSVDILRSLTLVNRTGSLTVDFKEHLDEHTFFQRLLRLDRIRSVTAYVEGEEESDAFTLTLNKEGVDIFSLGIVQNKALSLDEHVLQVVGTTHNQTINLSWRVFTNPDAGLLAANPPLQDITAQPNASASPANESTDEQPVLPVDYSFSSTEDAHMQFDLSPYAQKRRSVFDLAFKTQAYDSVTVSVEGHETDEEFGINLTYLELDRFNVSIKRTPGIRDDVYILRVR